MKEEINDVSQSKLTHTELAETADSYLTVLKEYLAGNAFLMALVALIQPALDDLRRALSAIRTNELVEKAFELDQVRDRRFILFRDLVAAYKTSDDPEEAAAYAKLWPVFEKIGTRLYDEGYLEQSGRLEVLFQELDKPEYQAAMEVLGVIARYNRLKTAEANFKETYNDRLETDAKKDYPTIKEARRALSPLVDDLLPTLRNVARTEEKAVETATVQAGDQPHWTALVNEQTNRVMKQVAARRTRSSADEGGATE